MSGISGEHAIESKAAAQGQFWPEPAPSADGATVPQVHGAIDRLAAVDWDFPLSTERGLTHGLHPWPGRFIPDVPRAAILELTAPGDLVIDPFCGCGTTALEALAAGRETLAADINPLAVLVAQGKCLVPDSAERRTLVEWLQQLRAVTPSPDLVAQAPPIPNLAYWFSDEAIAELVYLRSELRALGFARPFLETVFSSCVVAVSRQESETRYRRIDREVGGQTVLDLFRRRLARGLGMAAELAAKGPLRRSEFLVADARHLATVSGVRGAALACFSPPYPNTFDYHLYHRFRMFWLGFDPRPVKPNEIGAHLRYEPDGSSWADDMGRAFDALRLMLRPGGRVLCIVGSGKYRGELVDSAQVLTDAVTHRGFTLELSRVRRVARHRRAFNLSDARLNEEHVLVFQR